MAKHQIRVLPVDQLSSKAAQFAKTFYDRRVYPLLTPVTVDPSHPFPHVLNKALCIGFLLRRRKPAHEKPVFGVVTLPRALPRLLRLPAGNGGNVRQDPDGKIRRYAHLGTGNYNPSTARFYSDLSLLTSDEAITSAVHDVFNYLTAYAEKAHYKPLLLAPRDMARTCIALIEREARHARRGRPARIIAKCNAVVDPPVIRALYRASQAGVEIDLIVRGQCALVPGLRGISSRIRVRSVVGRFLEHSRIFYFENGGEPEIYLGSADWMPRNLYERVEVLFPLKDPSLRERISKEILSSYLADNRKARVLGPDGQYTHLRRGRNGKSFSVQEHLMDLASGNVNGSGRPRELHRGVTLTKGEQAAAPSSPSEPSVPPRQESLDATV